MKYILISLFFSASFLFSQKATADCVYVIRIVAEHHPTGGCITGTGCYAEYELPCPPE